MMKVKGNKWGQSVRCEEENDHSCETDQKNYSRKNVDEVSKKCLFLFFVDNPNKWLFYLHFPLMMTALFFMEIISNFILLYLNHI